MVVDTRYKKRRMARPKQFSDRTTLAFPPGTFAAIAQLIASEDDRSDFIRSAVDLAVAIKRLPTFAGLQAHLLANETIEDFCLKAVARAIAHRKAILAADEKMQSLDEAD